MKVRRSAATVYPEPKNQNPSRNMSYIESPVETVKKFANTQGWRVASPDTLASDFLSISNETNSRWDPGWYEIRNGKLYDLAYDKSVEDSVAGNSELDNTEKSVIRELQDWVIDNESGVAYWISPKKDGYYPLDKISIYRIAYKLTGEKILLRTHYLFEGNLGSPEDFRKIIFTQEDSEENIFKIISFIDRISKQTVNMDVRDTEARKNLANYFATQFVSGIPIEKIVDDMQKNGFLGKNPISCGASGGSLSTSTFDSGFQLFTGGEVDGWHSGTCRVCGVSTWVGPCSICAPCASRL